MVRVGGSSPRIEPGGLTNKRERHFMMMKHTNDSLNVAYFAEKHPGWHTYGKDKRTLRAVERARVLGSIIVNEFNQFHISRGALISAFDNCNLPLPVKSAWLALHENTF